MGFDSDSAFIPEQTHDHENQSCPLAKNDAVHLARLQKLRQICYLESYYKDGVAKANARQMLIDMRTIILPRLHAIDIWAKYARQTPVPDVVLDLALKAAQPVVDGTAIGCSSCNWIYFCYVGAGIMVVAGLDERVRLPPDHSGCDAETHAEWEALSAVERYTSQNITVNARNIVFF